MQRISLLKARAIFDSRGTPTVEVELALAGGSMGRASAPRGASRGSHEALDLRDGEGAYGGLGVERALANLRGPITEVLIDKEWDQVTLDGALVVLDGTATRERLGANALLATSLAFARAAAIAEGKPFYTYTRELMGSTQNYHIPVPLLNVVNGGAHAAGATDVQEYLLIPHGFATFSLALRAASEVQQSLRNTLAEHGLATAVGDEGGIAPRGVGNEKVLALLVEAIAMAGYQPGTQVALGIDVAASELYKNGSYEFMREGKTFTRTELLGRYKEWCARYPLISIEDGFAEDDWEGHVALTRELGSKVQVVGDDLFVTSAARIAEGAGRHAANAVIIKPNQVGTLTEVCAAVRAARAAGYRSIFSHRSGETEDVSIAHLAVGTGAEQFKSGALCRGERTAKYNELLRIAEELGEGAHYLGGAAFAFRK